MKHKRNTQHGFGHLSFLVLIFAIIGVVAVVGLRVLNKNKSTAKTALPTVAPSAGDSQDCSGKQLLKQSPVALSDLSTVIPLGNFEPPSHVIPTTHMYYLYINNGGNKENLPAKTTIYAPANITVTQMMLMDNNDLPKPYASYRIDFTICKQVSGYFILVQQLSPKLSAVMHEPWNRVQASDTGRGTQSHNYFKSVNVQLTTGDIIGYAGGEVDFPDGIDFGLSDTRVPAHNIAGQSRWGATEVHYVCSLDYYPANLSAQLYKKIGNYDYQYVDPGNPKCGDVYQDQPGAAQGAWFSANSAKDQLWDVNSQLALAHSNYNHSLGVFSMGNNLAKLGFDTSALYSFTPKTTGAVNLDFNLVKPGGIYCYETTASNSTDHTTAIIVQLPDTNSLKIGKLNRNTCGSGPWQFSNFLDYVR